MTIQIRNYKGQDDYIRISDFLIKHHQPNNIDGNWLGPAWEYMHNHPYLDTSALERIGIWADDRKLVAVVNFESRLGEAFFQFHPAYKHLKRDVLEYAENFLSGVAKDGRKYLCAFVNDVDAEFNALIESRGYTRDEREARVMMKFSIPSPFPAIQLPKGFHLTSLAEECDWAKVHRVMWRGFNHGDDVPMNEEELESRRKLFDTPKAVAI